MKLGKKLIITILSLIIISTVSSAAEARSVYVISDTGTWETDIPIIQAYNIQGTSLILQTEYECVHPLAIGIAIDPESQFMFITHEE